MVDINPYASGFETSNMVMVCSRSNIIYAIRIVRQCMENTGRNHWEALKWVFIGSLKDSFKCTK